MNKQEFLSQLRKGISGLPQDDIDERVSFYSEMIEDRMEEGLSEEEATEAIGPVDTIISQIIADTPFSKLVKEKIRSKKKNNAWMIVLLVIGSPVWLSLLIAAFAVIFSLYAVLWAVVLSFWAVFVSLAVCTLGGIVGGILLLCKGNVLTGLALIGAGVICAGLSVLLYFFCLAAVKGSIWLTKKLALSLKKGFANKEEIE